MKPRKVRSDVVKAFGFLLSLSILFSGCANLYQKNYISTVDKWPLNSPAHLLPATSAPKLLTATDMKADALSMLENGYLLIGKAAFRGSRVDEKQALEQARKVGASIVMVDSKFVNTVTESVPINEWIPDRQIDTTERTIIQDGSETPKVIQKDTNTVVQGEFRTNYINQATDYYDYEATFWAKSKSQVLGVFVGELDAATKSAIQSNKGVYVKAVVKNSPAFDADILRGDVLVALGGEEIRLPDQFFDLVSRNAGKTVPLTLIRSGIKKTFKVVLNPE